MIVRPIAGEAELNEVRRLFREYEVWLAIDLSFQDFERELAGLPGEYQPPRGRLLIAVADEDAPGSDHPAGAAGSAMACVAGCIALRPLDLQTCEMKRFYVRPQYRNAGLGRLLVRAILDEARSIGYARMRLDTLPKMGVAQRLYESFGFREIEPYGRHPVPGTRFLEADLL